MRVRAGVIAAAAMLAIGGTLLAACAAKRASVAPQNSIPPTSPPPSAVAGTRVYRIDGARSEVLLRVYRAGALARLGHNHIIVNHSIGGAVGTDDAGNTASLELAIPVAAFTVDEPQRRGTEGENFSEPVSDDARAGTLHNMLSPAVLDAERFPAVTITGTAVAAGAAAALHPGASAVGTPREWQATLALTVAGHASTLRVVFTAEQSASTVTASGTAQFDQSALGLTPFSALMGALQVQDRIEAQFKLIANRGD